MRLPFEASAAAELEEAAAWYERERSGYGALFVAEVRRAVERPAEAAFDFRERMRAVMFDGSWYGDFPTRSSPLWWMGSAASWRSLTTIEGPATGTSA